MVTSPGTTVRNLFRTALVVFVVTVVIGTLDGIGVWRPPPGALLAHAQAGTLGWIALSVMGATLWMFGGSRAGRGRALAGYTMVAVPLYVLALWVGSGIHRPIAGTLVLIAFTWLLWWAVRAAPEGRQTVPKLALLLSLVALFVGSVLGVLLDLQQAGVAVVSAEMGQRLLEAQPRTMVAGFVVIAGLGISEWLLRQDEWRPLGEEKAGVAQVSLFFLAATVIVVGILIGRPELARVGGALQTAGLVVFLTRVGRHLKPSRWPWIPGLPARLGVLGLVVGVSLFVVMVERVASGAGAAEVRLLATAYDHANFLLVMTNIIFGLMTAGSQTPPRGNTWIVAGVNLGAVGFVVALLANSIPLRQVFTSILGLALLWAIFAYLAALPRVTKAGPLEAEWKASS